MSGLYCFSVGGEGVIVGCDRARAREIDTLFNEVLTRINTGYD